MERLTVDYGEKFRPFRYAMANGSDAEVGYFKNYDAFFSHMLLVQKLGEYEDLEEQGRLVKLPCNVGDTVYVIETLGCKTVEEYKVISVDYHSNLLAKKHEFCTKALLIDDPRVEMYFRYEDFGKIVFLTREEAEAKLKKWRVVKR